jgi:hypothetical protein
VPRWWEAEEDERYWLEITDRTDLGVDLRAPQRKSDGTEYWSYALLLDVAPGDVVFHYVRPQQAITAVSLAVGDSWEEPIQWAAHGTVARNAGVQPFRRPGWRRSLDRFALLPQSLSLAEIRAGESAIRAIRSRLATKHGSGSLYFPFEISDRRPLRPVQGYLTKLPSEVVDVFPALRSASSLLGTIERQAPAPGPTLGATYREADERSSTSERDPFAIDPALVDRGLRGHATAQNALANHVSALGISPRSPALGEPNFDLSFERHGCVYVAEVKSLTRSNEEKQLRLGLGQVLRYAHLLRHTYGDVRPLLMLEREPSDPSWSQLCATLGVELLWPAALPRFQPR